MSSVIDIWRFKLWKWADKNNIDEVTIPREVGQLTQLTRFSLNSNSLTELPQELGQLMQLKILDLSDNNLSDQQKIFWGEKFKGFNYRLIL